jgi:L-ascorbate metabolism protein UlaG (beta-lactamase superfamily)
MRLRYFSHSACQITTDDNIKILIDPFLDNNPTSPVKSADVEADFIILSHAHGDHTGDSEEIAKRCNSTFICVNELANYYASKGFKTHNMHIGGSHKFPFGKVKFTIAHHGSVTNDNVYGGEPAGIIIEACGRTIYHTGDTGLFYDMKLIGEMNKIDYMLLPIGDNFTMGIDDAIKALEFVKPDIAIPIHYNTFPVIEANPEEFRIKAEQKGCKVRILEFGEEIEI